jgi:hypothetical protein
LDLVAGATESEKIIVEQVRDNVAHRPARAHRGRSPFRFIELPKQLNEKVTLMAKGGSHIDCRPELHHDLHSREPLAVMPTTARDVMAASHFNRL